MQRIIKKSTFSQKTIDAKSIKNEQSKALKSDGEIPAKNTKNIIPRNFPSSENLCPKSFLEKPPLNPEKKDKCIPLNAKMWERPAVLKKTSSPFSKYSLEPDKSDKIKPPAFPHENKILLKIILEIALKCFSLPKKLCS